MRTTIEQEIIAAKEVRQGSTPFVRDTMKAIKKKKAQGLFESAVSASSTHRKVPVWTRLQQLPRYASVALSVAGIIATGSIGYAAYNWFGTEVKTTGDDRVTVTAQDCPPSLLQQYRQTYQPTMSTTYKVLRPELISKQIFKDAQLVECEQRAIIGVAQQAFPDKFSPGDAPDDTPYPASSYGTVASIGAASITIRDVPRPDTEERATVTLAIQSDTKIMSGGEAISVSQLKVHDKVFFSFQNVATSTAKFSPQIVSTKSHVLVLSKTQYDYRSKDALQNAAAQNAFTIEASTDEFAG